MCTDTEEIVLDDTKFMAVSKICGRQNLSVKRVLSFLSSEGVIPEKGKRFSDTYVYKNGLNIITTNLSIRFEEHDLMCYLSNHGALPVVSMVDEMNELYDTIRDVKYRFERINAFVGGRIAFIDAEFKDGNYHEVAWEIREDGKLVEKKYFIVRDEYLNRVKFVDNKLVESTRIKRLRTGNQPFIIATRKHINYIMKNAMRSVDRIVAHNAFGERNMLLQNGIFFKKSKFFCTSKMAVDYIFTSDKMPSLVDLVEYYKIPINSCFLHYAHEDARIAAEIFYKMIAMAKKEFGIA